MNDRGDPELVRLLLLELSRHLAALEASRDRWIDGGGPDLEGVRRALHALKGSAGLAGEHELAEAAARLERRTRAGEAIADLAVGLVGAAIERLARGEGGVTAWPAPPPFLAPTPIEASVRAEYVAEVSDRLAALDAALAIPGDPVAAVGAAYRHLHTLKGAASAANDEPMSWFCHGLEERLRDVRDAVAAEAALAEVVHFRGVLGALADDPEAALRTLAMSVLRNPFGPGQASSPSAPPEVRTRTSLLPRAPTTRPDDDPRGGGDEGTVRVEASSIERLFDRLSAVGPASDRLSAQTERILFEARRARQARAELVEALRLIGPPKPWGAPAAALSRIEQGAASMSALADALDEAAAHLRAGGQTLRDQTSDAKREVAAMRQTPIRKLFARLASAIEAEARRTERAVMVRTIGAEEAVDRRLVEALAEPCLQLARNAVAHGIEPRETRRRAGKAEVGTVTLAARRHGSRLRITIADDGAGVDVAALRERAVAVGGISAALAEAADDDTLLALLFLPGFSMRETTDVLAGRGIGLDIALSAIQRIGGVLRLSSRKHRGFSARVEIVTESGLVTVLFVSAGGETYAVPVPFTGDVARADANEAGKVRIPHLGACVKGDPNERAPYILGLRTGDDDEGEAGGPTSLDVGIDAAGPIEAALVRPLSPVLTSLGPFSGAVLREDGALVLALDVDALAPRVRALVRVPDAQTSAPPR